MNYPDTVRLASETTVDGYGDRTSVSFEEVPAAFVKRAGVTHGDNRDAETSDAAVYLFPSGVVLDKKDDLEGMYIIAAPFGDNNWYRISSTNIAERKLLNNTIDNIYCRLQKVAGLAYEA